MPAMCFVPKQIEARCRASLRPALCPDLNRAILLLAPRFEARDIAPETLPDLKAALALRPEALPVWAGASDATIYGCPHVNHAFRAWHDAHHAAGLGEAYPFQFDKAGEAMACEAQCLDILRAFPRAPRRWLDIIRAEINGQVAYVEAFGHFPADQYQFVASTIGG